MRRIENRTGGNRMASYTTFGEYRKDLIREIRPLGKDILKEAINDSRDHLELLVKDIISRDGNLDLGKAFSIAAIRFGYPMEIAEAYRNVQ